MRFLFLRSGLVLVITVMDAGNNCDGQVLVTADLLGLTAKQPPFAKAYTNLREVIKEATENYIEDVKGKQFLK